MSSTAISDETKRKYSIPLFLALIAAGLAGNYFKFPIFLNIDFLLAASSRCWRYSSSGLAGEFWRQP